MPINMTIAIRAAVGATNRATNSAADVKAVQQQLNGHMGPSRTKLAVDGKIGPKTIGTIRDFQKAAAGIRNPDGRVDPRGKTEGALNDPASSAKFARMTPSAPAPTTPGTPTPPGVPVPYPTTASPTERKGADNLQAAIKLLPNPGPAQETLDILIKDYFPAFKGVLATLASSADAAKMAKGFSALRTMGMSAKEAAELATHFLKYQRVGVFTKFMDNIGTGSSKLAKSLKALGKGAVILAVVITAVEVGNHWNKGRYGAAAGEVYKLGMGLAIPWAGLLDAVQTMAEAMMPSLKGNTFFEGMFMMLRAINPLAAGAVAVDAVISSIQITIETMRSGRLDMKGLDALCDRMRASPLQVFTKIGDGLGDWIYDTFMAD